MSSPDPSRLIVAAVDELPSPQNFLLVRSRVEGRLLLARHEGYAGVADRVVFVFATDHSKPGETWRSLQARFAQLGPWVWVAPSGTSLVLAPGVGEDRLLDSLADLGAPFSTTPTAPAIAATTTTSTTTATEITPQNIAELSSH